MGLGRGRGQRKTLAAQAYVMTASGSGPLWPRNAFADRLTLTVPASVHCPRLSTHRLSRLRPDCLTTHSVCSSSFSPWSVPFGSRLDPHGALWLEGPISEVLPKLTFLSSHCPAVNFRLPSHSNVSFVATAASLTFVYPPVRFCATTFTRTDRSAC